MHAGGQPHRLARREGRVQADQAGELAARRGVDRLGQRRGQRRRIERAAHRAEQHVARQDELLGAPAQGMRRLDRARQRLQQRREAPMQVGMVARARRLGGAGGEERIEGGLVVEREARRQRHVGRRDAVHHAAPHRLRELALVLERHPRPVRGADQVDALGAELAPHRVEVLHRDRGREQAQVALAPDVGQLQQLRLALDGEAVLAVGIGLLGERLVLGVRAHERRRAAGAALVDEDDVAPVVEPAEERHRRRGDGDRALAGPAGEEEHRIGELAPRHRRHDDVADRDAGTLRTRRVERAQQRAAEDAVADAGDVAVAERGRRRRRRRRGGRRVGAGAISASAAAISASAAAGRRPRPIGTGAPREPHSPPRSFAQDALQLTAGHEPLELARATDQRALDEDHRKSRPAGPHLERVAASPCAEVAAELEVVMGDAGGVEELSRPTDVRIAGHADDEDRVRRRCRGHVVNDVGVQVGDGLPDRGVQAGLFENGAGHGRA
jgi:hypothetical protein